MRDGETGRFAGFGDAQSTASNLILIWSLDREGQVLPLGLRNDPDFRFPQAATIRELNSLLCAAAAATADLIGFSVHFST